MVAQAEHLFSLQWRHIGLPPQLKHPSPRFRFLGLYYDMSVGPLFGATLVSNLVPYLLSVHHRERRPL